MAKICFRSTHYHEGTMIKLRQIDGIILEYQEEGYKLTVRQLFYQMVGRGLIDNNQSEYRKISSLVVSARMGGLIDFDAIEDRVRVPRIPYWYTDPKDGISDLIKSYRLNRQIGQSWYTEVWSEKDALSGLLYDVTKEYHVRLVINRGYSSCSAMYQAFERFSNAISREQKCRIIYLGDHDPSGKDMIRDIIERMEEFGISDQMEVIPVALTLGQINAFNPPPYFAKIKDPRAKGYIKEYGNVAWEVDALSPKTLKNVLEEAILEKMDMDLYNLMRESEAEDIDELTKILEGLKEEE